MEVIRLVTRVHLGVILIGSVNTNKEIKIWRSLKRNWMGKHAMVAVEELHKFTSSVEEFDNSSEFIFQLKKMTKHTARAMI